MQYFWIAVLAIALLMEALTTDLVAIWFFPAALVCMILAFLSVPVPLQLLVFVLLGLALVFATRPLCKKLTKSKNTKTNVDALIGATALVTQEICNIKETGEVKVNGLRWSARAVDPARVIAAGEEVEVLEIRGVKLIVK
ncbi:MAG: NfeD family protein [Ruminococcaceae bacterium]|nr:NfeD family protein [Oscillospiraceae bacterium]